MHPSTTQYKYADKKAKLNNEILQMMDEQVALARRRQQYEIQSFRKAHQQSHQRRDFDLYDPNALRNDLPARTGDLDPRIGASSLQRFEGEDLAVSDRIALQKEQMRVWVNEQVHNLDQKLLDELNEKRYFIMTISDVRVYSLMITCLFFTIENMNSCNPTSTIKWQLFKVLLIRPNVNKPNLITSTTWLW